MRRRVGLVFLTTLALFAAVGAAEAQSPGGATSGASGSGQTGSANVLGTIDNLLFGGAFRKQQEANAQAEFQLRQEVQQLQVELRQLKDRHDALSAEMHTTTDPARQQAIASEDQQIARTYQQRYARWAYLTGAYAQAAPASAARGPVSGGYDGQPVYRASQCTGPVIMGVCHGGTVGPPMVCHGQMLNGQCTGPMF